MKILSIGFKNPFHKSGYTNTIEINNLENINVFIGKNNSGKTNVLRSIYNLWHQDIDKSKVFRYLKVKLDYKDTNLILGKFYDKILKIYQSRNNPMPETDHRKNRLKSNLENGKFVNTFNPLFNLKIKMDNPFSKTFSMILDFKCDVTNQKILFNYEFENIDDLDADLNPTMEEILKRISLDQDLASLLIDNILLLKNIILIPSFRTLDISEKKYQDGEIREIKTSIATILDHSFDCIPINIPRNEPFKIPNLALMLSMFKEDQLIGDKKKIMNPAFFEFFNFSLRKVFPEINLSIDFKLTELTTKGGYQEYGRYRGDWTKLGHGTQQLISLLFLLILPRDCVYIIDEPENGLHPGLQLKLLKFIKEIVLKDSTYSKQFFFATHSTSFIDFRGNCSHFVCEKTKNSFSVKLLEKDNLNILREVLGFNPGTLLQANGIIWVEGISDIPYIEILFRCFDISLEDHNVIIRSYFGKDNILSGNLSIEMLKSFNPNFLIIMDSDKKSVKDQPPGKLINKQKEFEQAGYKFWTFEEFCDIEGILPQETLINFFNIKTNHQDFKLKDNYEKLDSYIEDLKKLGVVDINSSKYDKIRDSKKISSFIKNNKIYMNIIKNNSYLNREVKEILEKIKVWENLLTFENIVQDYDELIQEYTNGSVNERKFILQKFQKEKEDIIYFLVSSLNSDLVDNRKVYQEILNELDSDWLGIFKEMVIIDGKKVKTLDNLKIFKESLIVSLKLYRDKMDDESEEHIIVEHLGKLFDNNHELIEKLDFRIDHNGDSILNKDFWIHLTRNPRSKNVFQFLVRKLKNGQSFKPDIVFLSKKYPNSTKNSIGIDLQVLSEFIEYLEAFRNSQ